MVGDYRKGEGLMSDPTEDLTMWVLPSEVARLLCRIIIWGKPIEIRLAHQLFGIEAAGIHRIMFGAVDGKRLKSTKLGALTNAALAAKGCPQVRIFFWHVYKQVSVCIKILSSDT
jgi:hypothetical protein